MAVELRLNRLERLTTDAGQNLPAQYSATAESVQANPKEETTHIGNEAFCPPIARTIAPKTTNVEDTSPARIGP